jgi:hypothetical protein
MSKVEDLKRSEPALFAKLLAFSTKEHTEENILFLVGKGNMDGIFNTYIKPGSSKEINIDGKLRDKLVAAHAAKDETEFNKQLKAAKDVVAGLSEQILTRFKASTEYKFEIARKDAEKNAAKAMKVLGISAKGKDLLLDAIAFNKIGKASDASKKLAALAKLEKLVAKEAALLKSLKDAGLA